MEAAFSAQLEELVSWRKQPALRNYAGTATYITRFVLSDHHLNRQVRLMLDLGAVNEVARVWVNGRKVGITWHPPHRLDITDHARAGTNTLKVEVANLLKNHSERGDGYTRPSGLLGPVAIRAGARIAPFPATEAARPTAPAGTASSPEEETRSSREPGRRRGPRVLPPQPTPPNGVKSFLLAIPAQPPATGRARPELLKEKT